MAAAALREGAWHHVVDRAVSAVARCEAAVVTEAGAASLLALKVQARTQSPLLSPEVLLLKEGSITVEDQVE